MKPIRLTARSFRSFADLDYVFAEGATAVTGSNGAGKSTLIGAVEIALFGPRSRSLEPLVREGEEDMQLCLEFEHAGETFRVRRGWKKGKSTLDLERWKQHPEHSGDDTGPTWVPLTQGSAADTQILIEATIGLSRSTFLASGYLAQRQSDSFTGAQPKDRKRILSDALALDQWQTDADKVGVDRRTLERAVAGVESLIVGLAERASSALVLTAEREQLDTQVRVATADEAVARSDAEVHAVRAADLDVTETQWKLASAAFTVAKERNDSHLAQLERTTAAKDQLHVERTNLAAIGQWENADDLEAQERKLLAAHEAYRLAKQERHTALQAQDELGRRGRQAIEEGFALRQKAQQTLDLIGGSQHCDTCGQTLGEEAARTAAATYSTQADALEAEGRRLAGERAAIVVPELGLEPDPQDVHDLRRRIEGARAHAARALQTQTRIEELERTVAETNTDEYRDTARRLSYELVEAEQELAAIAQPEPGAADQARAAALQAKAAAEAHASRARTASERLAAVNALLEQAKAAQTEHAAAIVERDRLHQELDILTRLEQAIGKDGMPAWIVESRAIPVIEAEANKALGRLGGVISRVELRTERETKAGDKRDALDVICFSEDGERALETFSGGEQTRAEMALAIGLVELLQSSQDVDLRFLALDEPAGLDTQGTEALAEILRERAAGSVILLASHDAGLRDSFDQSVMVERGPGGSRVTA